MAIAAIVAAQPALAWKQMNSDDGARCAFAQVFDGPGNTTVAVHQDQKLFDEDLIAIGITNENWSITAGDEVAETVKFEADDYEFWAPPVTIDHGLLLFVKSEHVNAFADSYPGTVLVWKGEQIIDRLDFSGFWAEFLMFNSCARKKREAKQDRERLEGLERDLPRDPFRPESK